MSASGAAKPPVPPASHRTLLPLASLPAAAQANARAGGAVCDGRYRANHLSAALWYTRVVAVTAYCCEVKPPNSRMSVPTTAGAAPQRGSTSGGMAAHCLQVPVTVLNFQQSPRGVRNGPRPPSKNTSKPTATTAPSERGAGAVRGEVQALPGARACMLPHGCRKRTEAGSHAYTCTAEALLLPWGAQRRMGREATRTAPDHAQKGAELNVLGWKPERVMFTDMPTP